MLRNYESWNQMVAFIYSVRLNIENEWIERLIKVEKPIGPRKYYFFNPVHYLGLIVNSNETKK